jgi:hypothetical protein
MGSAFLIGAAVLLLLLLCCGLRSIFLGSGDFFLGGLETVMGLLGGSGSAFLDAAALWALLGVVGAFLAAGELKPWPAGLVAINFKKSSSLSMGTLRSLACARERERETPKSLNSY